MPNLEKISLQLQISAFTKIIKENINHCYVSGKQAQIIGNYSKETVLKSTMQWSKGAVSGKKDIEKKEAQNKLFVGDRNSYIGTHATRKTKIMTL